MKLNRFRKRDHHTWNPPDDEVWKATGFTVANRFGVCLAQPHGTQKLTQIPLFVVSSKYKQGGRICETE